MKPECEKRLAVVIGGASDHDVRRSTGVAARGLSGLRVAAR
jgi:hypothetical protein